MSVRERSRLMSFPDSFEFIGGIVMGRVMTGQAVPPLLAKAIANEVANGLKARTFRGELLDWFGTGEREYPWRQTGLDPFHVLLAEVMLRKTRADAVVPVWRKMVARFPDPASLAAADSAEVESMLHPIGLSRIRAEALVHLSDIIVRKHLGHVPEDAKILEELPEIGPYIANATLCFGFGERRPILDANVHRVFTRVFGLPSAKELHKAAALWEFAERILPVQEFREFNLALLDFAAKVCLPRQPLCTACFANSYCSYYISPATRSTENLEVAGRIAEME
jgi:A/G-specific adenine glycosylase